MFDAHPNLASGTILTPPTPASSGATFILYPGDGSAFEPNMPVTLCPPDTQPDRDKAEIGYLTAVAGDTLTITRHQEGTSALPVEAGWKVYGTITAKTITDVEDALAGKVDQESGKGLSTNDYTTDEKGKLAGVATGATQNAADAALRHRTTHTGSQAISTITGLQDALDAKVADAELTTHTSNTSNPHSVTKAQVGLSNVDNTSDLDKPVSTAAQAAFDALADVATSGDYNDLDNLPSIPNPYTDEMARDALGSALIAGSGITITANDGADTVTIATTGASPTHEHSGSDITSGLVAPEYLGTGTPGSGVYLRGDGVWVVVQVEWGNILGDIYTQLDLGPLLEERPVNSQVVHIYGAETINDIKEFTSSPIVPTPTNATDAANMEYADTKEPAINAGSTSQYYRGDKSWETLDKTAVGLPDADNTSDLAKPVSTATQAALDLKVNDDDSRLSDARVPTNGSVTDAKVAVGAGIALSKLELDPTLRSNHAGTQSADTLTDGTTNHVFTAADDTKLGGIATGATANSSDATLLGRSNHTGTQSADTVTDGTTNKAYTATEQTKLAGVATAATANSTDAQLRDRSTHTGTQTSSTISDFTSTANTAADARIALQKGATSGIASLDGTGKIPSAQLPAGIDEVNDDYATLGALPGTGETSVIYVTTSDNKQYRWTGTQYIEIVSSPGSTDSISEGSTNLYFTTGRASAAAPVQSVAGMTGAVALTKSNVGLSNVDNTSDANKPVSTATQTALNAKEPSIASGTTSQYIRGDKSLATLDKSAVGLSNVDNTSDLSKPLSVAQEAAINATKNELIALSIALG